MKKISGYFYIILLTIILGISVVFYYNSKDYNEEELNLGDVSTVIDTGFNGDIVLSGSVKVPSVSSKKLKLSPNVTYKVSFDYVTSGSDNKFNIDLFPDSLPERIITATKVKQHYEWFVSSSNSAMSDCQLRFFDNQEEAKENDIIISNVKMEVSTNPVTDGISTGLSNTITLSGAEAVPSVASNYLGLVPGATYIVSFDYVTSGIDNKFNIDLFPDTLPEVILTATKTKQHYEWAVSSRKSEVNNCQLRFFDNQQEANESDIVISNIKLKRLDNDTSSPVINTGFTGNIVLKGSDKIPSVASNYLSLETNTEYIVTFDYKSAGGENKFNVDLFPDTLPEIQLVAKPTIQRYTWKVSSNNNDIKNCQLRFFDNQEEANEQDIIISNVSMVKYLANSTTIDTGFPNLLVLLANENVPVFMSKHLNLDTNKTYTVSFDYRTIGGNNKFNIDLFPDSLPEIELTATPKLQHYEWTVSSNREAITDCQLRFFDNQQEANDQNIVITNVKMTETTISNVKLNKESLSLLKGTSETLKATVEYTGSVNKTITWKSSNNNVATVDSNGKVTGISAGVAIITATSSNGKSVSCKVTITNPVAIDRVSLNQPTITIGKGGSTKLTVTISPSNATNKAITWKSSNNSVATVDNSGNIKGISIGEATITVTSNNGKMATCTVKVTEPIQVTGISLNKTNVSIVEGTSVTLTATISPNNATNNKVTWTSGNNNIAKVDENGKVTGINVGEVIIAATSSNGRQAKCVVKVTRQAVKGTASIVIGGDDYNDLMGQTFSLNEFTNVSINNNWNSIVNNNSIKWNSSDTSVIGPSEKLNGGTVFIAYKESVNKKVTLTGTISNEKVAEIEVTIVPGTYRVTFSESNYTIDKQFGQAIGSLPTIEKVGYNFDEWRTSNGSTITESTIVTKNITVYPKWTTIIPESYDIPSGYSVILGKSYVSDTLKYKTFQKNNDTKYFTLIWVKDPYNQINSANNDFNGGTRGELLDKEIKTMGYENKGIIAVNGGFTINRRSNIPVLIDKGNRNKTINVFDNEKYSIDHKYGTLTVGRDGFITGKAVFTPSEARIWLANQGGRNTWAYTHFKNGNWNNDPKGYDPMDFRTMMCQIDKNNFALYVGYEKTKNITDSLVNLHNMFNCQMAVNLDGGGSTGMYYKTKSMGAFSQVFQRVNPNEINKPRSIGDMLYFVE